MHNSSMAKTLAEQLTSVQAAIEAIESGAQSVSFDGQAMTQASLQTLYDREERLELKIARAGRQRFSLAQF